MPVSADAVGAQTLVDDDFLNVMKSWVGAAAVVATWIWVGRPVAGSSIVSDTESAANAEAGAASAASTTTGTSSRRTRAGRPDLSMRPPYRVQAGAPGARRKPWTFLTDSEPPELPRNHPLRGGVDMMGGPFATPDLETR